ncbi:glycosyltransferase [Shewanella maritima]|uniref:Glycosyltransferase n=1 Tax=Shewanella maritima TaxID=2520507 RepID=A0A411PD77_9GAMM|nr:glycosyltransferase family 2 protein [Shewanella maritima]QBF81509.1 glycosyltransferase [Shewanella maritima]
MVVDTHLTAVSPVTLSIVIPMYNEVEGIDVLFERLNTLISDMDDLCEVVFVDDGSHDGTWQYLLQKHSLHFETQYIRLSRNFGKEAAMTAGLESVRGEAVILLDADLQDPPELIPEMLAKWREGFDVVNMKRRKRHGETWFKRFSAACFYKLMNWLSDTPVHENVGDFRLLSRQVVDHINAMPERNRFMKGILSWPGFAQATIEFDRHSRQCGDTKWNYGSLIGLAMDGITSFSFKPLRLATYSGVTIGVFAFVYGLWIMTKTLVFGEAVAGYASIMVTQLFLAGVQLLAIGLIGEYVGRVFVEVKQRPIFIVAQAYQQHRSDKPFSVSQRQQLQANTVPNAFSYGSNKAPGPITNTVTAFNSAKEVNG